MLEANFTNQFAKDAKLMQKRHKNLDALFFIALRIGNGNARMSGSQSLNWQENEKQIKEFHTSALFWANGACPQSRLLCGQALNKLEFQTIPLRRS